MNIVGYVTAVFTWIIFCMIFMQNAAAPVNETSNVELLEEVIELQKNLSDVWHVMHMLSDRLGQLEDDDNNSWQLCDDSSVNETDWTLLQNATRVGDDASADDNDREPSRVGGRPLESIDDDKDDDDDDDEEEKDGDDEDSDDNAVAAANNKKWQGRHRRHHHRRHRGQGCRNQQSRNGKSEKNEADEQNIKLNRNVTAYCNMRPNKALPPGRRADVRGRIYLVQKGDATLIMNIKVSGLVVTNGKIEQTGNAEPAGHAQQEDGRKLHAFHAHEFGNLTNGCESAGEHFNPLNMTHGGPTSSKRHLGDFGNLESNERGVVDATMEFEVTDALRGPHSLIGRTLVIHEREDDLGSNPEDAASMTNGNSGARLACCVIHKLN